MTLLIALPEDKESSPPKTLLDAVNAFLDTHYEFRCNPKYRGFFGKIRVHIDKEYAEFSEERETGERYYRPQFVEEEVFFSDPPRNETQEQREEKARKKEEDDLQLAIKISFSNALKELIEAKGVDHVEVYKRANIDRKLFSKICTRYDYIPSKKTIIALALALELSYDETQALLERAGFTLSRSILFDVIIEYFISQGNYDIFEINSVLFAYKQPILG